MGNTSVEQANGDAKAVTGSTAPPEKKDHKRRPGETDQEYLERMRQEANERPASKELMGQKADELRDMRDSIQSDPHYPAWRQNISPEAYNNPTSFPGVSENRVLSQGAGGDREATMSIANTSPYSFMAADGKIYSGDANSGVYQPSGVNGTLASASSMYGRITGADPHWADAATVHPAAGPFGDNQNPMALGRAMQRPNGTQQQRQAAQREKEKEKEKEKKPEDGVSVKGEPVEVTRGEYIETWRDYVIPGSVELDGARFMAMELASPDGVSSPLGACQTSVFDEVIVNPSPGELAYYDSHGRVIAFERPFNFLASRNESYPQFELKAPWLKRLTLTERRTTRHFKQFGDRVYRIVALEDQRGARAEFERTPEGILTGITGPDGLSLRFDNDANGRRVAVDLVGTDGSVMPVARYAYDERGRMTSADCTLGMSVRYSWHPERDLLTGWSDSARRSEARFTHDADGRVVHTATSGAWNNDRFHYDREARTTRYVPGGDEAREERFDYDDRDRVTSHTDALGHVTRYTYDSSGHRAGVTDALGATTGLRFDAWGNIAAVTDGAGRETLYRRGSRGEVMVIVDGEGASRRFEHDALGNVVVARDAEGHETRYDYDARGNLTAIRHPDGAVERRAYDAHNRLVERSDARGASTRYEWDAFGRCVSVENPEGGVTRVEYEPSAGGLRAPTRVVRPDGVAVTRRYDVDGSVTERSDGAGRVWRYEHGPFGVLRAVTDPTGARLTVSHDPEGRVASVTNAQGLVYRFERDVAGRIVAEVDYDRRRTTYARDAAGRVREATLPDGSRLAFEHDGAGLVTRVKAFASVTGEVQEELTFAFDGRGLMSSATSFAGAVTFERDRNGRVVRERAQGRVIEHVRDAMGERVERRIGDRVVRYARDAGGAVRALSIGAHEPLEFTRDLSGRELRRASAKGFVVDQTFDAAGRLASQRGTSVSREYGWSSADTLVSIRGGLWGDVSYERDGRDQIVRAARSDGSVEGFSYDPAMDVSASWGAVASERSGDPAEALPASVWIRAAGGAAEGAYGPRGERVTLTHDACGRVVARQVERSGFRPQTWRYEWDALGRLKGCSTPQGERWTYGYDAFGRRLWKRRADAPRDAGEIGRAYLWDGDHIAVEAPLRQGGAPDWSASVSWHYDDDGHRPIAREEGDALHYVVCDHLGTPRELTDEAGGLAFAQELSVWGASLATYPAGRDDVCPLRFQGQWADAETGLYYNRFRHYDPLAGQYATPDPVGLLGGVRPHGYAPDPSGWVDPLGLDADKPKKGDKVYRVYGGDAKPDGASWTPDDPRLSPNYRDAAGLPSGGPEAGGAVNSGRFLVEGTLNNPGAVVLQRPAIGLDGLSGGAREWIIPNGMGSGAITPTGVWGVNPQF